MDRDEFHLGRFRIDVRQRELTRDGIPVQLGGRARDILCVLASADGAVVSKDELMTRVWPGLVVEENNIQVQISALRKALDDGPDGQSYLVTVPGRGYRLVGRKGGPSQVRPPIPHKPSIAVPPFQSTTADPRPRYFSDGVVGERTTPFCGVTQQ